MNSLTGSDGFSPVGLRVLVIDRDISSMNNLVKHLTESNYLVTTCTKADDAVKMLEHNEEFKIAIVMTDVNMGGNIDDGFEFLESVVRRFDVPVILMTANGDTDIVKRGIRSGACGYLHKPIADKDVCFLWTHVYRKTVQQNSHIAEEEGSPNSTNEIVSMAGKRKRELDESSHGGNCFNGDSSSAAKRVRTVWTKDLHTKFLAALTQLKSANQGVGPKKILKLMNEPSLTVEQVASHLQKHKIKEGRKLTAPQVYDTNTNMYTPPDELMSIQQANNNYQLPATNNMPLPMTEEVLNPDFGQPLTLPNQILDIFEYQDNYLQPATNSMPGDFQPSTLPNWDCAFFDSEDVDPTNNMPLPLPIMEEALYLDLQALIN